MTTPAGWYDDGSGRQRWWDGTQWTEHFAPVAEPAAPTAATSPAEVETDATIESVAAVETSWSAAPTAPATDDGAAPSGGDSASEGEAGTSPAAAPEQPAAAPEQPLAETVVAPGAQPEQQWQPEQPAAPETPSWDAQPAAPFTAPGATGQTSPFDTNVPPYGSAAPAYPGAAPAPQPPTYPGAAPGYPGTGYASGAAGYPVGGYPGGVGSAPAAPARLSVLGLVGLGLAALGTILAFIPFLNILGFVLLGVGFITSLISLFLKGRKWPGITGLILSVVGAIIGVVMAIVFFVATVASEVRDFPTSVPSSDSDTGTDDGSDGGFGSPEVVEGTMGEAVTVTQLSGSGEVTVKSATWTTSDGSSIPATNGGFVVLDITWTGVEGTSYVNPIYFGIETAEGVEGAYDFFADGQLSSEELAAGQSVDGTVTFDVAQSGSYTVIVKDEMLQDVARIAVTTTAG